MGENRILSTETCALESPAELTADGTSEPASPRGSAVAMVMSSSESLLAPYKENVLHLADATERFTSLEPNQLYLRFFLPHNPRS